MTAFVVAFVVAEARRRSVGSMKALLSPLRSLLRFLFIAGIAPRNLTAAVPGIANPQLAALPKALDTGTVAALPGSCDRATAVGRRDFAVLTVLVQLGLRAGEVAALQLDDIDWRAGELAVQGKGNRLDRLPLAPMAARRWSTTCGTAGHPCPAGRCSCGRSDPTAR